MFFRYIDISIEIRIKMMIVKYEGRWFQVRTVEKVAEKLLTVHSASSVFLSTAATSQKLHINYRETHY